MPIRPLSSSARRPLTTSVSCIPAYSYLALKRSPLSGVSHFTALVIENQISAARTMQAAGSFNIAPSVLPSPQCDGWEAKGVSASNCTLICCSATVVTSINLCEAHRLTPTDLQQRSPDTWRQHVSTPEFSAASAGLIRNSLCLLQSVQIHAARCTSLPSPPQVFCLSLQVCFFYFL